jgi:hypothetical protein
MTPTEPPNQPRRIRLVGSLSVAASAATVLLAALAIGVMATAEIRVRGAIEAQHALDQAVQQSAACSAVFAGQTAAWKSYVLCELQDDERGAIKAKSALATATSDLNERIPLLAELAEKADLPTTGVSRINTDSAILTEQLIEAIADTRGASDVELVSADRTLEPRFDQARHDFSALFRDWNEIARTRRVEATMVAAETAGRVKAWIEILSVAAVVLVTAVGVLAVGKERGRGHG